MKRTQETDVFKPAPSRIEAKNDATTRVAREIIDTEVTARNAKTARLRAARLAQEMAGASIAEASPRKPKPKRQGASRKTA